ncbi:MAG: FAD binding domain-containing protein [Dehalococcoidia bacterium]
MQPFAYVAPKTLDEAIAIMSEAEGEARPLVGGSDLIAQVKEGRRQPTVVVNVKEIPETNRLEFVEGEGLHIGSAVSCTATAAYAQVGELYPAIKESCLLVGSIQIQNRASIGGNICNAAPSADTVPALLTYEARAVIAGPKGRRELPLEQFFVGPGQTALERGELLVETVVPPPPPHSSSCYLRFIPREEMDIAVAGVGSLMILDPKTRQCTRARIALAAVAPTPIRAREVEALLEGKELTERLLQEAGELASQACRPISDVRGSAEYRLELVKVLTRRTLKGCLERLGTG